jgi:hypothetical protein
VWGWDTWPTVAGKVGRSSWVRRSIGWTHWLYASGFVFGDMGFTDPCPRPGDAASEAIRRNATSEARIEERANTTRGSAAIEVSTQLRSFRRA